MKVNCPNCSAEMTAGLDGSTELPEPVSDMVENAQHGDVITLTVTCDNCGVGFEIEYEVIK